MLVVFLMSLVAALFLGGLLYLAGIKADGHLYHRETLALVGVGWLLTALRTLPYLLSCHM